MNKKDVIMQTDIYQQYLNQKDLSPYFGQALIRDIILPDILGDDMNDILYFEGKQLARRFPLANPADVIIFFSQANLGTLAQIKINAKQVIWNLSGTAVQPRVANPQSFMLEAGFLAQQSQRQLGLLAEAEVKLEKKGHSESVQITVHVDPKDVLEPETTPTDNLEIIDSGTEFDDKKTN